MLSLLPTVGSESSIGGDCPGRPVLPACPAFWEKRPGVASMGIFVTDQASGQPAVVVFKQGARVLEPDVYRTEWRGQLAVVKDYSRYQHSPLLLIARWMVRHEAKMLRLLSGWPYSPEFLGMSGKLALVMQYVPGQDLDEMKNVGPHLFQRLQVALAELHAAGITHNDLRRTNILINDGRPVLVDFTSAWRFPRWLRGNPLSRQMYRGDYGNFLKLRQRMLGTAPTPQEAAMGAEAPWVGRLRQAWRRLYRPFRHKG